MEDLIIAILVQIVGVALDKGYDHYRKNRKNKKDTPSNAGQANEKKS
jgi:hypothetical protein